MNRSLKELAEEAGYPDYMTYGQDLILERFAELIVQECARHLSEAHNGNFAVLADELKEHFGVES